MPGFMESKLIQLRVGGSSGRVDGLDFTPLPRGVRFRVLFVYPNIQRIRTPQLGIAILSSCLKRIGAETRLFDTTSLPRGEEAEPFENLLREFEPDLIAYSLRSNEWPLAKELLAIGRARNVPQILGGPHATHAPDESILEADALVIGEGEGAIMDIARALASGKPLTGIANTWVSTGETGLPGESGVVKAPKRDLIHDLDTVPLPDWRLFPKEHYEKSYIRTVMGGGVELVAAIEGSRGCPFTCTYCSNTTLMEDYRGHGRWRREKSPERIVDELDAFRREFGGLDFVYWVDEIFLTGVERLKRFRDLYRNRIGAPFSIMERPECITEEKMAIIAEAGLHYVAIGLESGDEALREKLLNRKTSRDVLERSLKLPKTFGVKVHVFTMLGLPGQDEASMMKTWTFMREVEPTTAQFSFFFPLKGTPLYDQSIAMGLYDPKEIVENYHTGSVLRQEDVITQKLLLRYHELFTEYATRPGVWPVVAFHVCRKSGLAFWLLFTVLPPVRDLFKRQMARVRKLLACTPRQAIRKIARNIVELPGSIWASLSRTG